MTFEQKIAALVLTSDPKKKADLINKFSTDQDFFVRFNSRTMPLKQYMELKKEKFAEVVKRAAQARANMKNRGWTDKKYQRYLAEIPEDLFLERPEFNAHLPQKELKRNIEAFLAEYPQFRVDK